MLTICSRRQLARPQAQAGAVATRKARDRISYAEAVHAGSGYCPRIERGYRGRVLAPWATAKTAAATCESSDESAEYCY